MDRRKDKRKWLNSIALPLSVKCPWWAFSGLKGWIFIKSQNLSWLWCWVMGALPDGHYSSVKAKRWEISILLRMQSSNSCVSQNANIEHIFVLDNFPWHFFFITVNFFAFRRKWKFNISFSLASVSSYHVCFGFLMCIEAASKRVCLTVHVMWLGVIGGMLWSFPLNLCWFGKFFFPEVFYVLIL